VTGVFDVFSSDHAGYRYDDPEGKMKHGRNAPFKKVANGVPGLEVRTALLFSEGVGKGRIDLPKFVALSATNAAKLYGLYPRKGTIAVGSDADLAIWDADKEMTITQSKIHDAMDYTPYEGMTIRGWPITTLVRGEVVAEGGEFVGAPGKGCFLKCDISPATAPLGRRPLAFARATGSADPRSTPITRIKLSWLPADQARRRHDDLAHRLVIAHVAAAAAEVRVQRLRPALPRSSAIRSRHRPNARIAMPDRRRAFQLGLATLGVLLIAAPLDAFAQAKPPVKVRYTEVVRSILYAPAYVAMANGYFKDAGLDVAMTTAQGGDKTVAALLTNSADIALIGPETSIYVQNGDSPTKIPIFCGLTVTDGFMLIGREKAD